MNAVLRPALLGSVVIVSAGLAFAGLTARFGPSNQAAGHGSDFLVSSVSGQPLSQANLFGKPHALFFGFTHCPEICPTTLYELDSLLDQLGAGSREIEVWFVTLDPERDTPAALGSYVSAISARITAVTGTPEALTRMARSFGIHAKRVAMDNGDYTIDHTASVLLLDRNGRLANIIAYGESTQTALDKLRRLIQIKPRTT
jgi:protein SCO1/2